MSDVRHADPVTPSAPGDERLLELHTRFLYPFFFRKQSALQAIAILESVAVPRGRDGTLLSLWENPERPHVLYREELLPHVIKFLFEPDTPAGCGYLRLSDAIVNRWFGRLDAHLQNGVAVRLHASTPAQTEVFLSNYGVGVLSIALAPAAETLDLETAAAFNYSISQFREQTAPDLEIPHPSKARGVWLTAEQESRIPAAPPRSAALSDRLGRPGGTFRLREIVDDLLQPLQALGLDKPQEQLSVYTVARFDDAVDFNQPDFCATLGPFLAGLAQVEEPTHAGAPAGTVGIASVMLNRKHWAAVSLLGAAHLVADQAPAHHPFNEARTPRAFLKYFVPYVLASLQQLTLRSIIREASAFVLAEDVAFAGASTPGGGRTLAASAAETNGVRMRLLEVGIRGHFAQVSIREVLHRYYGIAQEGLSVPAVLREARQALSDIDAKQTADRQIALATDTARTAAETAALQQRVAENIAATKGLQEQMTEHLRIVARVQEIVEFIEMIVVGVSVATLYDFVSKRLQGSETPPAGHGNVADAAGVLVAAAVGFFGIFFYVRWRKRNG